MAWWVPKRLWKNPPPSATPPVQPPPLLIARYLKLYPLIGAALSIPLIAWCASMLAHDHFVVPMLLFPLPMTFIVNVGGEETTFCVLAALQLPLYGLFMGYGRGIGGIPSFSIALLVAHFISIGICFMSFL